MYMASNDVILAARFLSLGFRFCRIYWRRDCLNVSSSAGLSVLLQFIAHVFSSRPLLLKQLIRTGDMR